MKHRMLLLVSLLSGSALATPLATPVPSHAPPVPTHVAPMPSAPHVVAPPHVASAPSAPHVVASAVVPHAAPSAAPAPHVAEPPRAAPPGTITYRALSPEARPSLFRPSVLLRPSLPAPELHGPPRPTPLQEVTRPGASRALMVEAGKTLIVQQQERAQGLLPTSGFSSLHELERAVSAMGPNRAKAVELLRDEKNFEFVMRAPSTIRDSIAQRGFLNQHDSGTSRGTLNPDYRANVEASFVGMDAVAYKRLPNAVKPKYGFLRPSATSGAKWDDSRSLQYGDDFFVFKRDAVKDHLTFYPTDSLGQSAYGTSAPPSSWAHALQPWSQRMILAAGLEVAGDGNLQYAPRPPGFQSTRQNFDYYMEIQIWRPLGLEDVERFEFTTAPPQGDFLKALRQTGVKIFKKGSAEEWKGDATTEPHSVLRMRWALAPRAVAA